MGSSNGRALKGKTHFNRIKKRGESWTALRQKAIAEGTFRMMSTNHNTKENT